MFQIKIELEEPKEGSSVEENTEYDTMEEDYDIDCIFLEICEKLDDLKNVRFIINGMGEEDWNVNCKSDLSCMLEQFEEILKGIRYKDDFTIDLYEQGMERELEFEFNEERVTLTCKSYIGHLPPDIVAVLAYEELNNMFLQFFNDFVTCIEKYLPEYLKNPIFVEWLGAMKELLHHIH